MALFYSGTSGGEGGHDFDDNDDTPSAQLLEDSSIVTVRISYGSVIDSIQSTIQVRNTSQLIQLPHRGGPGGSEVVKIDVPSGKFISRIQGQYGTLVDSMSIFVMDNQGDEEEFGPFGGTGGPNFYQYVAPNLVEGEGADIIIVGFWGSAGSLVDAIGVIFKRPR